MENLAPPVHPRHTADAPANFDFAEETTARDRAAQSGRARGGGRRSEPAPPKPQEPVAQAQPRIKVMPRPPCRLTTRPISCSHAAAANRPPQPAPQRTQRRARTEMHLSRRRPSRPIRWRRSWRSPTKRRSRCSASSLSIRDVIARRQCARGFGSRTAAPADTAISRATTCNKTSPRRSRPSGHSA